MVEAAGNIITKSDPGFVNYSGGDFTIKEDSSVYKENPDLPKIDFENIGLLKECGSKKIERVSIIEKNTISTDFFNNAV